MKILVLAIGKCLAIFFRLWLRVNAQNKLSVGDVEKFNKQIDLLDNVIENEEWKIQCDKDHK